MQPPTSSDPFPPSVPAGLGEIARAVATALSGSEGVRALFLSGSLAADTADAWSDLDLLALAPPGARDEVIAAFFAAVDGVRPLVMRRETSGRVSLANAITEDWRRCDLLVLPPDAFPQPKHVRAGLVPLIDPDGRHGRLPGTLPPASPDPARVAYLVEEFIRVLGLLPVALGRRERLLLVTGAGLLRDLLRDLMLEKCPLPDREGVLHPSRLLTDGQVAALEALPHPGPDRDRGIEAQVATARVFLPLAHRKVAELNLCWPGAFYAATREALRRAGVSLDWWPPTEERSDRP